LNKWGIFVRLLAQLPLWVWSLLIILYIVAPIDLIPDLFGLPGRLDDLLIALGAAYYLRTISKKRLREKGSARSDGGDRRRAEEQKDQASENGSSKKPPPEPEDPYKIIGVNRSQSLAEIQRRYKEKLLQYHPDRVEHLGGDLKELAEKKTKELNQAFQRILREKQHKP